VAATTAPRSSTNLGTADVTVLLALVDVPAAGDLLVAEMATNQRHVLLRKTQLVLRQTKPSGDTGPTLP
jgi:hypothetical protein